MSTLALPVELGDDKKTLAYNAWLDLNYLKPLRAVWPNRYEAVVQQLRAFILSGGDDDEKDQESFKALQATAKKKRSTKKKRKTTHKHRGRSKGAA
jgi:hypothetical protein